MTIDVSTIKDSSLKISEDSGKNVDVLVASSRKSKEKEYWLNHFAGDFRKSIFPYDFKYTGDFQPSTQKEQFTLSSSYTPELLRISADSDSRLHIILAAAVSVLLYKYSGNKEITIASPIYKQEEDEDFINTVLLLKNPITGDLNFKEAIIQMRETMNQAVDHYRYPVQLLARQMDLPFTNQEACSLFDVAVLLENIHDHDYLNSLNYHISFSFLREQNNIEAIVEYSDHMYNHGTVLGIISHFQRLLEQLLAHLDQPVRHMEIMSEQEKHQILHDFNDTSTEYPGDKSIVRLFQEQVLRTPNQTALVFKKTKLTYKQLDTQSEIVARMLKAKGVAPNSIVAIIMERSIHMVVGLLGILKAGGAYLPIDYETPVKRIHFMLEDSKPVLVLLGSRILEHTPITALQGLDSQKAFVHLTPPRPQITDMDSLPFPDRSLVDYEKYSRFISQSPLTHLITLQGTRGCPYGCAYCHKIWPKKHVFRSAENIFEEVHMYYKMGVRRFSFVDDIFNLNVKNSSRFFQLVVKHKLDVNFFFLLRGDILTEDYIDLMVEAGVVFLRVSLETASRRMQKMMGKNLNIEKLRHNLQYVIKKYPHVIIDLNTMHGFPSESEEEAMSTLDFIKDLKWLDFPYVYILKIYPDTEMEKLAIDNGIPQEAITNSASMAFHELPETLPFPKEFTLKYQSDFFNNYFLSRERLAYVLPYQMDVLTEWEMVKKYSSYLPVEMKTIDELFDFLGVKRDNLSVNRCKDEELVRVPQMNERIRELFPQEPPHDNALKILLLDASQHFTSQSVRLNELMEPPLGLMYLLSHLKRSFGRKVNGKISKSLIDFNSFEELKQLLEEFKPDLIGIRCLTFYKDFFHQIVAKMRQWGIDVPIISGGPYASSDYRTVLQDENLDLVVMGEGEITFNELIGKMLENDNKLPPEDTLKQIPGLAFVTQKNKNRQIMARKVIMIDEIDLSGQSGEVLPLADRPDDLAYAIYTSGSTGQPKGVLVEHRNVVNVTSWFADKYQVGPGTNILNLSNYTFDASVNQIFASLLHGAALHMIDKEMVLNMEALREYIRENRIHIVNFIPTMLNELLGKSRPLNDVKYVLSGGESLDEHLKGRLIEKGYALFNQYGPTETTIDALVDQCSKDRPVSLGIPINNTQCYIFDNDGNLVPVGIAGEIYVAGAGVARGYLNNPELTAEKFEFKSINHEGHGGREEKKRLYKTGDLARWLPDGRIEFLGRIDQQVKIRGNRIELGEIECQLLSHPDISETVIIAADRAGNGRDPNIYAYYVSQSPLPVSDLRTFLGRQLPDFMVPSFFISLDSLPRTATQKIDVRALPTLEAAMQAAANYTEPRNPVEKRVVRAWEEILKLERISIYDNFFELGGNSIQAIQLVSHLIKDFDIAINHIFKYQTPAALCENLQAKQDNIKDKILEMRHSMTTNRSGGLSPEAKQQLEQQRLHYDREIKAAGARGLKALNKYKNILLTGATGYLGAHLAAELLDTSDVHLHVLVRGDSLQDAEKRLMQKFSFYFGPHFYDTHRQRLSIIQGDLRRDNLGMSGRDMETVRHSIDAILHSAANVKHYGDYADFFEDNVMGTRRLMELALNSAKKPMDFHHISTLSVGTGYIEGKEILLFTEFLDEQDQQHTNVYIKSKIEAEQKVMEYRARGLNCCIYRMGNLVFHSQTGKFQENIDENAFYANIKALVSLGAIPDNYRFGDMTFVDSSARAVVRLMFRKNLRGQTFHIKNNHSFTLGNMDMFMEKAGIKIQTIRPELFLDYLLERMEDPKYRTKIERFFLHSGLFQEKEKKQTTAVLVSNRTGKLLEKIDFNWLPVNEDHIELMVRHCREVGFFEK
jgi:amino acid adenylation domain-containing protein/thioester reductase-like protein